MVWLEPKPKRAPTRAELPMNQSVGRSQTLRSIVEVTMIEVIRNMSLTAFIAWGSSSAFFPVREMNRLRYLYAKKITPIANALCRSLIASEAGWDHISNTDINTLPRALAFIVNEGPNRKTFPSIFPYARTDTHQIMFKFTRVKIR